MNASNDVLTALGLSPVCSGVAVGTTWREGGGTAMLSYSPIDGARIATIRSASSAHIDEAISAADEAFRAWRSVPAPVRGELVRRIGERVRAQKHLLAPLITLEVGKIPQEALGEVQEWIDICDFAVGLSRQLYGLTIASERPGHRMMEQWHPLGAIGCITAFNFPMAVWAWNAMVGLVCGDTVVWKPSEKASLCAIAVHRLVCEVMSEMPSVPPGVVSLVCGGRDVGTHLAESPRLPLISATGSVRMGQTVAAVVGKRLGRSLLELGGNNALVVAPSADLELAVRAIVFSAVGTCGQRCTSLRRLIVHHSIAPALVERLKKVYAGLPIGDPRTPGVLVGPLIDVGAAEAMDAALASAKRQGGTVHGGGRVTAGVPGGAYVRPALVEIGAEAAIVRDETFAPILYIMTYDRFEDAIARNNGVPQGLSSAIITRDVQESERFLSAAGSDCGIANVNIGTSGAEIGGAFGGEKQTGGGRESGSDSWKSYMRRTTNTINYSGELPLAQGVEFPV
ncbi:MAG: aldehyde dehydrogenase family protein [Planctomycetes bacterium]|nr:aldehyde dehydrogenase family protein [Planctomycetota bacterium]